MLIEDPLISLSAARDQALSRDLPSLPFVTSTGALAETRPTMEMVDFIIFPQVWSTHALGFDEEPSVTGYCTAYTVIAIMRGTACVYFGSRLAYRVAVINEEFQEDLEARQMRAQDDCLAYGATLPEVAFGT